MINFKEKMNPIPIYFMPGMAANPKIFEFIDLSNEFKIYYLSWITPKKNELLSSAAHRNGDGKRGGGASKSCDERVVYARPSRRR